MHDCKQICHEWCIAGKSCATHTSRIEIIQAIQDELQPNSQIALAVWVTWVHHSDIPAAKSLTIHPASWQARCMSLILCYARETFENGWNVMDCTHQSSCGCGMLWMWSWYTPGFVFSTTVSRLQPSVSLVSFKSKTSTFNAARKHIGNVRKPWIDNLFQNLSHSHHHLACVCVCVCVSWTLQCSQIDSWWFSVSNSSTCTADTYPKCEVKV